MTRVVARRRKGFTHDITLGDHKLVADEPPDSTAEPRVGLEPVTG